MPSSSNFKGQKRGLCAAACERLVQADLAKRGFEVTIPISATARHDLHVELPSVGWRGVQVRAARLRKKRGLKPASGRANPAVDSPILALVFLPHNRIEYRPGKESLPLELR